MRDDLASFAEDVRELERGGLPPGAAEPFARALACYGRAELAYDRARSPEELEPATAALAEGRYELARARAALEGGDAPEWRPPCFFDPRHGPAVQEVEWGARVVGACQADTERIARGDEPEMRHLFVDGRPVPHWSAPPTFDAWRSGYYGSGP